MNQRWLKFWPCLTNAETCKTEKQKMDVNRTARTFPLTAIAPKTTKESPQRTWGVTQRTWGVKM
jgi:hypothetical protein